MSDSLDKINIPAILEDGSTPTPDNQNDDKDTVGITSDHVKDSNSQRKSDEREEFEKQQFSQKCLWEKVRFWVKIIFISLTVIGAITIPGTYLWHTLAPSCWRWLPTCELQNIKDLAVTIITGVTVSVGVALMLGDRVVQK